MNRAANSVAPVSYAGMAELLEYDMRTGGPGQ
ncbi:hypothetical protein Rrhod_1217 [Rhodococcus rhodnii LMG 5362]|uniref:Uncharacterized protein n=1 Tax=Rhodococcus rhodnii LMG 5362 TaxID=1273125 RepID=R7WQ12_9NOCA|nr:hypothetical protein Rrhod_1217 [Rhodococcus rhodnii LMG 5362]